NVRSERHVGEWRVSISADSLDEVFAEASHVVSRQCGPVAGEPGPWETVHEDARDAASLLVNWVNELISRSEVEGRAYAEVRNLRLTGQRIDAEIRGRPVRIWQSPLKAATYHGLTLTQQAGRWKATVILDV